LGTLIFVILNLYDFHTSGPVNCQVCIISPGLSYAWADRMCRGKLLILFGLVSHLVRRRAATEDLSTLDICLFEPLGRFFADRPSHVRQFSIILKVKTFHNAITHIWWLRRIAIWNKNRIAVAIAICALITSLAFQIRSMSPPFPNHGFEESDISSALVFLYRYYTSEHLHPPS
jgi:hypothetical protein